MKRLWAKVQKFQRKCNNKLWGKSSEISEDKMKSMKKLWNFRGKAWKALKFQRKSMKKLWNFRGKAWRNSEISEEKQEKAWRKRYEISEKKHNKLWEKGSEISEEKNEKLWSLEERHKKLWNFRGKAWKGLEEKHEKLWNFRGKGKKRLGGKVVKFQRKSIKKSVKKHENSSEISEEKNEKLWSLEERHKKLWHFRGKAWKGLEKKYKIAMKFHRKSSKFQRKGIQNLWGKVLKSKGSTVLIKHMRKLWNFRGKWCKALKFQKKSSEIPEISSIFCPEISEKKVLKLQRNSINHLYRIWRKNTLSRRSIKNLSIFREYQQALKFQRKAWKALNFRGNASETSEKKVSTSSEKKNEKALK